MAPSSGVWSRSVRIRVKDVWGESVQQGRQGGSGRPAAPCPWKETREMKRAGQNERGGLARFFHFGSGNFA